MYTSHEGSGGGIYKIEFYQNPAGDYPVQDFIESLPRGPKAKIAAWLRRLQEHGPNLRRPYADLLESPILELRVSFGRLEIRLLYFIEGKSIIVTHGFLKKKRRVPSDEIQRAKRYRNDWFLTWRKGGKRHED